MTSKEYLAFVLDQLSEVQDVTFRSMMGEYLLYKEGLLFGGLYDNRLLPKPTEALRSFLKEQGRPVIEESPYPGAKKMLLIQDCEDQSFLKNLLLHC